MKQKLITAAFIIGSWTWGIVMTLVGAIATLVAICLGGKPTRYGPTVVTVYGKGWGGASMGMFIIIGEDSDTSTKSHEVGHSLQDLILGPLMPFVVSIPSAFRYWLRNFNNTKQMNIFTTIVGLIALAVGGLLIGFGFGYNFVWVWIVGIIWAVYALIIMGWAFFKEIPQYKDDWPLYDDIWFEGKATKWGTRFMLLYLLIDKLNVNKDEKEE